MIKPRTPFNVTPLRSNLAAQTVPNLAVLESPKTTHDDIAWRAYEIYVTKGCPSGQCEQNWLQAEQELRGLEDTVY